MAKVILDAGHGGEDPGAVYEGRQEKDDNLRLALAVGDLLEDAGTEVVYTRLEDVYNTPLEKAQMANEEGGDFFLSFHRNSSPEANQYSGVETLVYDFSGEKMNLAEAINAELSEIGFRNLGVKERPGLIVLRRTKMPAILIETGFLNTDADNLLFDEEFDAIAVAIADAVLTELDESARSDSAMDDNSFADDNSAMDGGSFADDNSAMDGGSFVDDDFTMDGGAAADDDFTMDGGSFANDNSAMDAGPAADDQTDADGSSGNSGREEAGGTVGEPKLYRVQTGAFRNRANAEEMLYDLLQQSFPAFLLFEDAVYKVQVGAFARLDNAVRMEEALRMRGYSTFITT